jgi:hypothetical protein
VRLLPPLPFPPDLPPDPPLMQADGVFLKLLGLDVIPVISKGDDRIGMACMVMKNGSPGRVIDWTRVASLAVLKLMRERSMFKTRVNHRNRG